MYQSYYVLFSKVPQILLIHGRDTTLDKVITEVIILVIFIALLSQKPNLWVVMELPRRGDSYEYPQDRF